MNRKKLKYGGFSLLYTALFLTGIILLNVFAGMLTERYFLKFDLTEQGLYTLDRDAAQFMGNIDETVDVIVLSEESVWLSHPESARLIDILQNYAAVSNGRIRVQYVNPDLNSFSGSKYDNSLSKLKEAHIELSRPEPENLSRNDIIVLSSRRAARIPASNIYVPLYDAEGRQVPSINLDQEMVTAMLYVLNENVPKVAFLEGHGEDSAQNLQYIFDRSGYSYMSLNLALEDISKDTVFVVSTAPKTDFLPAEIIKLENYLSTGGNAVILYDFNTLSLPNLDEFLRLWGVSVDSKLVCDASQSYGHPALVGARVMENPFPSLSAEDAISIPVLSYYARPIRPEWSGSTSGRLTAFPLIQSYGTSYAKDYGSGDITTFEKEDGDETGPFTLAYDIRHLSYDAGSNQVHSHLIVSSIGLLNDEVLALASQYRFNNPFMIVDIANDLNPFGQSVYIQVPRKLLSNEPMVVSAGQSRAVLFLMVIVLPLAILAIGIFVWRKRRHQ
ncbi:MAG: GldG family protein [Oscillospiraceae bacterium]|nr:GldG family protein [Oscillospiraceae bacterium]